MRVLLTTRGSAGHLGPITPFAHACMAAGHDVLVAAQSQNRAHVERAGLPFAPVPDPPADEWVPLMEGFPALDIDAANRLMLGEFFAGIDLRAELAALHDLVRGWRPDVIVRESWEFGSSVVAELEDVPIARVGLGLAEVERLSVEVAAPAVETERAKLGLEADPEGRHLAEAPYLTMMPEVLEPAAGMPPRTHRFRFTVPEDTAALPDWWDGSDAPLVYLTFGSVTAGEHLPYFPALYRTAIDALAALEIRLLVTIGDAAQAAAQLGPLPDNVHVETWVPHDAAVAAASLVVCHGGYGSTLGTLAHGSPLVVVPLFSSDQWANAFAVERAGAGVALTAERHTRKVMELPGAATIDELAPAVQRVLEDSAFRERSHQVAEAMRRLPPVDEAVDTLASIAAEGRPA